MIRVAGGAGRTRQTRQLTAAAAAASKQCGVGTLVFYI